jgi:hypothetical protein
VFCDYKTSLQTYALLDLFYPRVLDVCYLAAIIADYMVVMIAHKFVSKLTFLEIDALQDAYCHKFF